MAMVTYVINNADGSPALTGVAQEHLVANLVKTGQTLHITQRMADPETEIVIPPSTPEQPTSNTGTEPVIESKPAAPADMVANKTAMTADGVDIVTIPGVPAESRFSIAVPINQGIANNDLNGIVYDGTLSMTTDVIGQYTITVTPTTTLPYTVIVNAN